MSGIPATEIAAAGRALLRLVPEEGPLPTPCWIWQGSRNVRTGYGQIRAGHRVLRVYHLLYRVLVREPDAGLQLHHRCENRVCANPHHLQEIERGDHIRIGNSPAGINARKVKCIRGHTFTPENTGTQGVGHRRCRTCHRDDERARRLAVRVAA